MAESQNAPANIEYHLAPALVAFAKFSGDGGVECSSLLLIILLIREGQRWTEVGWSQHIPFKG